MSLDNALAIQVMILLGAKTVCKFTTETSQGRGILFAIPLIYPFDKTTDFNVKHGCLANWTSINFNSFTSQVAKINLYINAMDFNY